VPVQRSPDRRCRRRPAAACGRDPRRQRQAEREPAAHHRAACEHRGRLPAVVRGVRSRAERRLRRARGHRPRHHLGAAGEARRAAAAKALALDSTVGEAHTALAYGTMIYDWDWAAAESSFRRAITVDPAYPTGHQWYGDFLWSQGRLDEALEQMQQAQRLDPLSLVIATELGQTYYLMHRFDQAEAQLRATVALDPNYPTSLYILGLVYAQQHRYGQAIDVMRR